MLAPMPIQEALAWASKAAGGAAVDSVEPLGVAGGLWLLRLGGAMQLCLRLGDPQDATMRSRFETEAAALVLMQDHQLAVPRLVAADLAGTVDGRLALLRTVRTGSSLIPHGPRPARLRALGAAAAAIHSITPPAQAGLAVRTGPIADTDFAPARSSPEPGTAVSEARRRIAGLDRPSEAHVLVHGDLWQGNILWVEDRLSGILDWDRAGIGPAGIDLGYLRFDVVMTYGLAAADEVVAGWEEASGQQAQDVAYWDIVAALAVPPDLLEWLPFWHDQGRPDLTAQLLNTRRDEFVRAALGDLG
jgi:aminoglycoside phosphotransferase (APT) family kinase protein